jgi:hypothetical protein
MHDAEDDVRFKCIQPLNAGRIILPRGIDRWSYLYIQLTKGVYPDDENKRAG